MIHHMPEPSVVANAKRGDIETYYGIRNRIWFGYQFLPMRYLLIYWTLWVGFFGIRSVRTLQLFPFSRGVLRGFASCRGRPRTPINGSEVTYLKKHHGRLYY